MRKASFIAAALFVLSASASLAQGWHEFVSREEFFLAAMPETPQVQTTSYRAASGAVLPAKTFTANDGRRRFVATVVHYMTASAADHDAALAHALQIYRSRPGRITYDNAQEIEGLPAHMIYHLNADESRTATGIIMHPRGTGYGGPGRLYILEGYAPAGEAPAIQFPQSFFVLDTEGNRLDFMTDASGKRVRSLRGQQQAGIAAATYNAREPVTCPSRSEPALGRPSPAQVAHYLKCSIEGVGDGALFLLDEIVIRDIGETHTYDADAFADIAAGQPVYPIRGSMVRYACERIGREIPSGPARPGANCFASFETNASGQCYRTKAGQWDCRMTDLSARKTMDVAPPK